MPSLVTTTLALFIAAVSAQQCYYPDGSTSTDIPCSNNPASSCCGSTSFCMDNGLCFGGGILSRGSCTDKSWSSQACTAYCKSDNPSSSIPLTPCSNDGGSTTFVCGLNGTACSSSTSTFSLASNNTIVLRASQVESLVGSAISSLTSSSNTTCPSSSGAFTGLGLGLGFPLLISLLTIFLLWRKIRKNAPPKLMYKLPDNHDEFMFQPPPKMNAGRNPSLQIPLPSSRGGSDVASIISSATTTTPPAHMQSFAERYKMVGDKLGMVPRAVELPTGLELEERRKSKGEKERERTRR